MRSPVTALAQQQQVRAGHDHRGAEEEAVLDRLPVVAYRCRVDDLWSCEFVGARLRAFGFEPGRWTADAGTWLRQIHPDDRERVARERLAARRSGWLTTEYRLRTASGEERWVHDRARVEGVETGTPTVAHGVLLDMTEQHQVDRVIEDSFASAASRADELDFAHTVDDALLHLFSHDVRSPLTAASGLVATLLRDPPELDDDRRRDILERVAGALQRALHLVEDLERAWDEDVDASAERVDLCSLLRDVVDEVGVDPDQVDVACDEHAVVSAIAPLLRRALVGLVRNAVVHTDPGTHVVVSAIRRDDGVVVVVEDDGPGIPDEAKTTVFEPFVRLAESSSASGMGLGLALVREAASLHGGEAWVEDAVEGGAAFHLFLPDQPRRSA